MVTFAPPVVKCWDIEGAAEEILWARQIPSPRIPTQASEMRVAGVRGIMFAYGSQCVQTLGHHPLLTNCAFVFLALRMNVSSSGRHI